MATYYVVCITKHPTHTDPHNRIQYIGTNTSSTSTTNTKTWSLAQVVQAIDGGTDMFYCRDKRGDTVKCITATHNGNKYVKTQNDGIQPDNLLAQKDC
jgi:hypothetical protein